MTTVSVELAHKVVAVELDGDAVAVVALEQPGRVVVVDDRVPGPPGPVGPQGNIGVAGPTGPEGPPGGTGLISYRHVQPVAAAVWLIPHFLGYKPGGVYAENSAHEQIVGRVTHLDTNHTQIEWFAAGAPVAESGEAFVS